MTDASALTVGPFTRLPPGRRHVLVPTRNRLSALAGLTLVSGSRPASVFVQALSFGAVLIFSPAVLPGPRQAWQPPLETAAWQQLVDDLVCCLGPIDGLAVYEQPQPIRQGFGLLLLRRGRTVGFAKLRQTEDPISLEARILGAMPSGRARDARLSTFNVPGLLRTGSVGGWFWLLMEPLPTRPHRPSRLRDVSSLTPHIRRLVEQVVPRPKGTPDHWVGVHGDMTPWNLRSSHGDLWLLDWESACWAPPGTDDVYYNAALFAVGGVPVRQVSEAHREAAEGTLDAVRVRRSRTDDLILTLSLETALEGMLGQR